VVVEVEVIEVIEQIEIYVYEDLLHKYLK